MTSPLRHVLVVDDDARLRDLLASFLRREGFAVSLAGSVAEAREQLAGLQPDALVLDIMMPEESGLDLLRELEGSEMSPPVLLLSARGALEERIEGLDLGADDFLPKPFEPRELVARLGAIMRRHPTLDANAGAIGFGGFAYDPLSQRLRGPGVDLRLPDAEASLLATLCAHLDEGVSREDLAASGVSDRAVDVQILRLRRRIEADPKQPRLLETLRGLGYRLRSQPLGGSTS